MAIKFLHDLDVQGNIDFNDNQALNAVLQHLTGNPTAEEGKIYYNSATNKIMACLGTTASDWTELSFGDITTVSAGGGLTDGGTTGDVELNVGAGTGITVGTDTVGITAGGVDTTELADDAVTAAKLADAINTLISDNTAKNTNVDTNLSEGSTTTTSVNVNSSDGTNATLAQASSSRAGVLSKAKFDEIVANSLKTSDINHNVTTNITIAEAPTNVEVRSSDGSNDTIAAANTTNAGVMTKAMFDEHELNNAKVTNVDETTTVLSLPGGNILRFVDEDGVTTNLDISTYLDDTNLARLTSGALNGTSGVATFTRDDASTFTIDMSAFLDAITLNNTLTSTSTTEGLTAAQGKALKDLIDGLVTSTGSNTGDEPDASLTVKGIVERATDVEALAGADTTRYVTAKHLSSRTYSTALAAASLVSGEYQVLVTHNLGIKTVNVELYETATHTTVYANVTRNTNNTVVLRFRAAPTTGAYTALVTRIN